jgi:hypothetical protein
LIDSVRGIGSSTYKFISSDLTTEENTTTTSHVNSIDSNGFTVQASHIRTNANGDDYVAWCWKAGGAASLNENGSIDSQVSANQDAGFSIVSFDNTTTGNETIGHGLSSAPELIIQKGRDSGVHGGLWFVYHSAIGATDFLRLNDTTQSQTNSTVWNDTEPTDSVFSIGSGSTINNYGLRQIAYCFHSVDGYQKVGSYQGTGVTGNKQTIGFRPRFLLSKRTSSASSWYMIDSTRNTTNPRNSFLNANTSDAEYSPTYGVNFEDDGFSFISTDLNGTNQTWIYLAIA